MAGFIQSAIKRPGAFRAKARKAGMSTSAFSKHVLSNKSRFSSTTVRQAALAKRLMSGDLAEKRA